MKTSLDHLPEDKQYWIRRTAETILEMVKPEMLILFGSYARGDWVEDFDEDAGHYRYQSDIDIIAITKNGALARKIERKDALTRRLHREVRIPVSIIADEIYFINSQLRRGRYFYADIYNQGIVLHDSGKFTLEEPKELPLPERIAEAQEYFEYWLDTANNQREYYTFAMSRADNKVAAFNLHQVTEQLYSMILLVFTHYKPKSHDLEKLRSLTGSLEKEFLTAFPLETELEKHNFELLRQAYVESRYNPNYKITVEELEWLAERVNHLQELAEKHCQAKIEDLTRMDALMLRRQDAEE